MDSSSEKGRVRRPPERQVRAEILNWFATGYVGISSKNIALKTLGKETAAFGWPHDADDFSRCYRMLKSCPSVDIAVMKSVDKVWADLVVVWDELTKLYENGHYKLIYSTINNIQKVYREGAALKYETIQL